MVRVKAKIIRNSRVTGQYFHLHVDAPGVARRASPGQFVMVKTGEGLQPLLRRPFSIHRVGSQFTVNGSRSKTAHRKPGTVEILYEVVGTGTELLSTKKPGESLDLLGPLGHGFDVHKPVTEHRTPILIAGGMGVAPLLFLAERLAGRGGPKARVLIGARTAKQILCEKEFKKYSCDVTIATDDGSRGHKGLVTELLTSHLLTVNCQHPALSEKPVSPSGVLSTIYACGPKPMLQAVSGIAREHVLAAQLSLEAHMACGIGACLGCVVKTKAGYERVCKEGPVFDALDIVW